MWRGGGLTVTFLISAAVARAGDPQANELVGLMTQAVRATTEQLQLVQHTAGARLSADALGQLDHYVAGMLAEERRVPVAQADAAILDAFDRAVKDLRPEWGRVSGQEDLKAVLTPLAATRRVVAERAGGRAGLAVRGVESIAAAVQAHELRYGRPPERLEQLAAPPNGGKSFLGNQPLTDPWGRPYRYDPAGGRNGGVRPDVWSLGPDAADANGVIGNWQAMNDRPRG
ncbi:MAG TPA: type II secretion system protein GspG [Gemmataceae bacterium]|jgi:hypothetical protein